MRSFLLAAVMLFTTDILAAKPATGKWRAAKITYQTSDFAYLNMGRKDGLFLNRTVLIFRKRQNLKSTCIISELSESHAICRGAIPRRGTKVVFQAAKEEPPRMVKSLPSLSPEVMKQGRNRLAAIQIEKVTHNPAVRTRRLRMPIQVGVEHRTHSTPTSSGTTYHHERVSLRIPGWGLGVEGLGAYVDLNMDGATWSPPSTREFGQPIAQLDLFELAIAYRPPQGMFTMALGRILPWNVAGITILDGVQLGVRPFTEAIEIGVYGGLSPDPEYLLPRTDHYHGGGYWALNYGLEDVRFRFQGRLGASADANLALRTDAEARFNFNWSHFLSAGWGARLALESKALTEPWLDLAYSHISVSPWKSLILGADYRYQAPGTTDFGMPVGIAPSTFGFHHALLKTGWNPANWFSIVMLSGGSFDHITGDVRGYLGPELGAPALFGGVLGLSVAYQEEIGAVPGRLVSSGITLSPSLTTRMSTRAQYFESNGLSSSYRTIGGTAELETLLVSWAWLRMNIYGHYDLPTLFGHARPTPLGAAGQVSMVAHFR